MSTEQAWHRQRKGLLPHKSWHSAESLLSLPRLQQLAEKCPPAWPSAAPCLPARSLKWFFASWPRVSQRHPVHPLLSA